MDIWLSVINSYKVGWHIGAAVHLGPKNLKSVWANFWSKNWQIFLKIIRHVSIFTSRIGPINSFYVAVWPSKNGHFSYPFLDKWSQKSTGFFCRIIVVKCGELSLSLQIFWTIMSYMGFNTMCFVAVCNCNLWAYKASVHILIFILRNLLRILISNTHKSPRRDSKKISYHFYTAKNCNSNLYYKII